MKPFLPFDSEKKVLITGAAGFIGFHLAKKLLEQGTAVAGLDNLNAYYDVTLKADRLHLLRQFKNFPLCRAIWRKRIRSTVCFPSSGRRS